VSTKKWLSHVGARGACVETSIPRGVGSRGRSVRSGVRAGLARVDRLTHFFLLTNPGDGGPMGLSLMNITCNIV
jgi:hypothetical protein